jgi:hypothetical protein
MPNDGQIRTSPSGPFLRGTLLNDVPLWDPVAGRWTTGAIPAPPASSGVSVEAHATTESDFFDTSPDGNFHGASGADFSQTVAHADWALTAAGCIYTYNGADPARFLALIAMTVAPTVNPLISHELMVAIDHDGDLIGTSGATAQEPSILNVFTQPGDLDGTPFTCVRLLTVNPGQTVQACGARESVTATDLKIYRFTFTLCKV